MSMMLRPPLELPNSHGGTENQEILFRKMVNDIEQYIKKGYSVSVVVIDNNNTTYAWNQEADAFIGETGNRSTTGEDLKEKYNLTPRELEIISLLPHGYDNKTLANKLMLSEKTVKVHLRNIYKKLKIKNRSEAVVFALRNGLDN